ncbi:BZ3500_MvSof-1268-A1-R1_Chr2-1g04523 [Microbotryum saponariae]|uniref:BZ3500_MvSof-1268-A1-R1_Chr2-1g04523 protein n=1 Tax=Microbotryum saponariae TaxID=289078 RepID=A0A2X0KLA8_9BASI|nr:BZ3500_MvSof-1268-A1-R1_Chr2-1g04523 [Microbotryum saponariae]SCZ91916.1 BZ3501_MvSof-1269-A2-R1_Chr2-1g04179 [Microbotryum saponariae]
MPCQSATLLVSLVLGPVFVQVASTPTPRLGPPIGLSYLDTSVTKDLSDDCMVAAVMLMKSQLTRCVDVPGFMTVLTADRTTTTTSLQQWTESFCSRTCNQAALSSTNDTVMLGCSTDITMDISPLPGLILMVLKNYAMTRTIACAETFDEHANCIVTLVRNLQQANNAVYSFHDLLNLGKHLDQFQKLPTAQLCSDCNKVLFTTTEQNIADATMRQNLSKLAQSRCGQSFINGALPSSVTFVQGIPSPPSPGDYGSTGWNATPTSGRDPTVGSVREGTLTSDGHPVVTVRVQLATFAVVAVAGLLGGILVL